MRKNLGSILIDEKLKEMPEKKCFISTNGNTPKIEYIGLWNMLDELVNKVKESFNTDEIKIYCELYERLYKLLENKGE